MDLQFNFSAVFATVSLMDTYLFIKFGMSSKKLCLKFKMVSTVNKPTGVTSYTSYTLTAIDHVLTSSILNTETLSAVTETEQHILKHNFCNQSKKKLKQNLLLG